MDQVIASVLQTDNLAILILVVYAYFQREDLKSERKEKAELLATVNKGRERVVTFMEMILSTLERMERDKK